MIHVVATINVVPGYREKVIAELIQIQPQVLDEDGCYLYTPLQDLKTDIPRQIEFRPDSVVLLEEWESIEHLKQHLETKHLKDYQDKVNEWVTGVNLQILHTPKHG